MKLRFQALHFLCIVSYVFMANGYRHVKTRYISSPSLSTKRHQMSSGPESVDELTKELENQDYLAAYQLIQRNPMIPISVDQSRALLNNLNALNPNTGDIEQDQKQVVESSALIYKRLQRQRVLKGFGCVEKEYPEKATDISPMRLEELTGLSVDALTPKERTNYWRLAGVSLCLAQYLIGAELGFDPLVTTIPATFLLFLSDQIFLRGAVFETIYQKIFPEYKKKIICHEAGHFLLAYLLGVSVRGCITNAWEARKYPDIKGQAGTIFYDTKLSEEMSQQKVTRSSLDRISVVIMAGIAAEAILFSKAEGGAVDEQSLITFLTTIQPPWNILRIQAQARWAVVQAILLIREHQASYDALVDALTEGKGVGDAVIAIENNLPATLPSLQRAKDKELKRKRSDADILVRYVQKMTYKVGGILPSLNQTDESKLLIPSEYLKQISSTYAKENKPTAAKPASIMDIIKEESSGDKAVRDGDVVDDAVDVFIRKVRRLEVAAKNGDIDLPDQINSGTGKPTGVWLNGLQSRSEAYAEPQSNNSSERPSTISSSGLNLARPVEGYEEKIEDLIKKEQESVPVSVQLIQTSLPTDLSASEMLSSNRGYMLKRLENTENSSKKKVLEIDDRVVQLKKAIAQRVPVK